MKSTWGKLAAVVLCGVLVASMVAGCTQPATDGQQQGGDQTSDIKAAMVTDVGGLGDKSFNDLSNQGLERSKTDFGIETRVLESKEPTDYESNIDQLVNAGYNPIFAVGFLMQDTVSKVATTYPEVTFGGIDQFFDPSPAKNVVGLNFKEQEAAYLAGVLAALLTTDPKIDPRINADKKIGFVGGLEIPPVQRFQAGFIQGAKSVDPDVEVVSVYTGSFTDQQKGKEAATNLIEQKCDVVFAAAGQTGLGSIKAAQENDALFIGVDADQFETVPGSGDVMVTSAIKRVDEAVYQTVKGFIDGNAKTGENVFFGLKEDGVGLAPYHDFDSKIPQEIKDKVDQARQDVIDGKVTVSDQVPQN